MSKMRFHVLGLAHTQTTVEYLTCAYTQKVRNFCKMMHGLGHEVYLYSGDENDAPCTEHIKCVTKSEQQKAWKMGDKIEHSPDAPQWVAFNGRACGALASRAKKGDFLCIIFGMAQKPVANAFPILKAVEFGVGYHHTFAEHRVFESHVWRHAIYTQENKNSDCNGVLFDDVIHGYLDPDQFHIAKKRKDYLLYIGRMINRKGLNIALETAKVTGLQLILAGSGTPPKGAQHVGVVGVEKRAQLMSQARAVMAPTLYLEPFGNVAIEAMASGTPVLTTNWGAFVETVKDGVTGYRCSTLQEFADAARMCEILGKNAQSIRDYAIVNFGLAETALKYERYFRRLQTLWIKGWYTLRKEDEDVFLGTAVQSSPDKAGAKRTAKRAPAVEADELQPSKRRNRKGRAIAPI